MNGILIVNKEKGFTSHDVVAKLRGILKQKKIGHTGTLDPEATGVLPVCLGHATKVCDFLMDQTKEYIAEGILGIETDTQDIFGTRLHEQPVFMDAAAFSEAVNTFVGDIEQLTPMFSARKVNGQKLCDLARRGIEVERKTKLVRIHEIEILDFQENGTFRIRVVCEKGTYIRTICHDIGQKLGCGACMTSLIRTKTGGFSLEKAHTLAEIAALQEAGRIDSICIPVDSLFPDYTAVTCLPEYASYLLNGNPLSEEWLTGAEEGRTDIVRVYWNTHFYALYQKKGNHRYMPLQMFPYTENPAEAMKMK